MQGFPCFCFNGGKGENMKLKVMKPKVLKIFVYGDSNTWGYVPTLKVYSGNDNETERYDSSDIWWNALKKDNIVYVNGNNGRTINNDHPDLPNKNALKTISGDFIDSDIDLVIIMLGTNDLKDIYSLTPISIKDNLDKLVNKFIDRYNSKIMIICPPLIKKTPVTKEKYTDSENKILEYEKVLKEYTKKHDYLFCSAVGCEVGIDGEHLTKKGHQELGIAVLGTLGGK